MICKQCIHNPICKHASGVVYECEFFKDETIKTEYDRIRNMSVEELAEFMQKCGWDFPPYCDYQKATRGICDQNCLKCAEQYLESEVDNNG